MTESEYRIFIQDKARKVRNTDQLKDLIEEIKAYKHDYGTIVVGSFAAMLGAFQVIEMSPSGGITGFQAGCLGWEAVREFMSIKGAARILDFDKMLYPQYEESFEKTISKDVWRELQAKAKSNLDTNKNNSVHPSVSAHWSSIVAGVVPFGYSVKE